MKQSYFPKDELKALMSHKGANLIAIATPQGLRLCPQLDKNTHVIRALTPLDVYLKDNESYSIEMGSEFCKVADMLDFTKVSVKYDGEVTYLVIGKKEFRMAKCSFNSKASDLNLSGYEGSVTLNEEDVKRVKNVVISSYVGDGREFMKGVYFDPNTGAMVATDGRRMAWQEGESSEEIVKFSKLYNELDYSFCFIIPQWIVPYLDDKGAKFSYGFNRIEATEEAKKNGGHDAIEVYAWWLLETNGATYLYRPIDGKFPNWMKVCPAWAQSDFKTVDFDFDEFNRVKKQAFTRITFRDGSCFQNYNGMELDYGISLPCLPEGVRVNFDNEMLKDGVKLFGKKARVQVALPSPCPDTPEVITKAVEFKDEHESKNIMHYIVMPCNEC